MKDDTSAIPNTSGCNILNSPTQITHYSSDGRSRSIYILVGDTWVEQQTNVLNYSYNYSDYNCIDVSSLNSQNVGLFPIYEFMIGICAGFVLYFVWHVVLKPLIWGLNE